MEEILGMITYGREEKKKDWIEGDVEQQCSPNRGPSNPTGLSDSSEWARPSCSQVASVIGCRLPLEGVTLGETVFFSPTIPREGCQLRVIWKHSLQQGNESFIPDMGFGQRSVASTMYSSLDFISHIGMLISICSTPISQMVYYMQGKKERNLRAPELSAALKSPLFSSIPQL